jgi:flagellar biosynthesis GTPase FlhF
MAEIKVKALDSATAMEEVVKRLGVDALIVSTRKIDGQIEIVATNDDPNAAIGPKLRLTTNPAVNFSDILKTKMTDLPSKTEVERKNIEVGLK